LENIRIKEWEEKFDLEKKAREQREIKREQRLSQRELEEVKKFDELENQSTNINLNLDLDLKKFNINKSTKN